MPIFYPVKKIEDVFLIENEVVVLSGSMRLFPELEIALSASLEIELGASAEVL